jgi:hypothetical protein
MAITRSIVDIVAALWVFFLGASIGSFVNVVAHRIPRNLPFGWDRSRCPRCESAIAGYDNIPILSWLFLRGRCRSCRAPIAARYVLVELCLGVAFLALSVGDVFRFGPLSPRDWPFADPSGPESLRLALWGIHALLASFLMTLLLLTIEKHRASLRFLAIGSFIGVVLATTILRYADRPMNPLDFGPFELAHPTRSLGYALLAVWLPCQLLAKNASWDLPVACVLAAAFLGGTFVPLALTAAVAAIVLKRLAPQIPPSAIVFIMLPIVLILNPSPLLEPLTFSLPLALPLPILVLADSLLEARLSAPSFTS